jgi:hypothetical protein
VNAGGNLALDQLDEGLFIDLTIAERGHQGGKDALEGGLEHGV